MYIADVFYLLVTLILSAIVFYLVFDLCRDIWNKRKKNKKSDNKYTILRTIVFNNLVNDEEKVKLLKMAFEALEDE